MTELEQLRAENRALHAEIAEWEHQAADALRSNRAVQRVELLRRRFRLTTARARVLALLIERTPHVVSIDTILAARGNVAWREDPEPKLASVMIWHVRAALGPKLRGAVRNAWASGYYIPAADAAQLLTEAGLRD